ncbi:MAG: formate transporter [Elusimicrobia bacterium RIFOXYA2_FULL_39_19]|nr:MAG: formate transporter [Elusimicrobia bacterium RIFOXYA2_FULL_39_19]
MVFMKPKETLKEIENSGCHRITLPTDIRLIQSFMAGAFIAMGGLLAVLVAGGSPGLAEYFPGIQKFLAGAMFPVGLILVVVTGAELFTGNVGFIVPGVMKENITVKQCVSNWFWVYVGNFIGSLFVAYFLTYLTGIFASEPWLSYIKTTAEVKVSQGFWVLLLKGIGCNWLVCLSIWLSVSSNDIISKICGIWFPVMAFVAVGFEHSIANMFFVPTGIFYGANVSWLGFFVHNLIPVTLGNIIGGGVFVGFVYWYLYGRN